MIPFIHNSEGKTPPNEIGRVRVPSNPIQIRTPKELGFDGVSPSQGLLPRQYVQDTLIRPMVGVFDECLAHRILADVLPFLLVTFRAAQAGVPRFAFLPTIFRRIPNQGRVRLRRTHSRICRDGSPIGRAGSSIGRSGMNGRWIRVGSIRVRREPHPPGVGVEVPFELPFPKRDPLVQRETQVVRRVEEVKVIRHEQVIADQPGLRLNPGLAEDLMHERLGKPTLAVSCNDGNEHDRRLAQVDADTRSWMFASDMPVVWVTPGHNQNHTGRVRLLSNAFCRPNKIGRVRVPSNPIQIRMPEELGFDSPSPTNDHI